MMQTKTKAHASAAAGGIVGALAAFLTAGLDMDPEAAAALAGIIGAAIVWAATYYAPANKAKG